MHVSVGSESWSSQLATKVACLGSDGRVACECDVCVFVKGGGGAVGERASVLLCPIGHGERQMCECVMSEGERRKKREGKSGRC